ncbi:MAG: hypothetical protein ACI8W8_002343 [Rhodothermales bacterium]|jgi:hypothetical protein
MRTFKSSCLLIILLVLNALAVDFEDGPLRVTLGTSGTDLIVADDMRLDCVVTAPAGLRVELPSAEIELKDWTLAEFAKEPPELLENGDVRYRLRYTLEPFLPGSYTLPVLVIRAGEWKVETPATEVVVSGVVEAPQKATLRPLAEYEPGFWEGAWAQWAPCAGVLAIPLAILAAMFVFAVIVGLVCAVVFWMIIRDGRRARHAQQQLAIDAIESASDLEGLAAALRDWAPRLLSRLDAYRFRQDEPDDISELICELRKELS